MRRNTPSQQQEPQRARQRMSRSTDIQGSKRDNEVQVVSNAQEWTLWAQSLVSVVRFVTLWLIVLYACAFGVAFLAHRFDGFIYPNVYVGNYNLGGYTRQAAGQFLQERFDEFQTKGVVVRAEDLMVRVHGSVSAVQDPDLSYELYSVDVEATVDGMSVSGRRGSRVAQGVQIISQLLYPKQYPLIIRLNEDRVASVLRENFAQIERPAKQPKITLLEDMKTGDRNVVVSGDEMSPGTTFAYDLALEDIRDRLVSLSGDEVVLVSVLDNPDISRELFMVEHESVTNRLNTIISGPELVLATSTATSSLRRIVSHKDLLSLIELRKNTLDRPGEERVIFGVNEHVSELMEQLAQTFGIEPHDAKFVVKEGKVVEFQGAQAGYRVSTKSVLSGIEVFLNTDSSRSQPVRIEVERIEPSVQTSEVNDLGIREIIGTGRSNFSGSPANRRHNIKIGAEAVNGTLVPPGEEFSLIKTLGEISGKTGYLPELVIKGDRTVPEYGGGLCQIGTTTFRGALDSGLPITARTNHSYRVSYYEPAGTDATIYDPSPDFRFMNDTGHHILIQTRLEGNEAIFEFWGTRDGRSVNQTKPRIFNIVAPPETKYIETTDLKPGEERCTERAHAGADAEFTYTVTYTDGTINEHLFKSRYRPWQAVCLKGVSSLSTTTPETF